MAHPVFFCGILALLSIALAIDNWHKTPDRVPLWWDLQAHPLLFVPKWFGLLLLPVLSFLIPYLMYLVALQDSNLQNSGQLSKHAADHIILVPGLLLYTVTNFTVLPAAKSETHDLGATFFVSTASLWFLWLGHIVQNLEPNSSLGLITPWTKDSGNFNYTQRVGGNVLMVSSAILAIAVWWIPVGWILLVAVLVFWLGPFIVVWAISYGYSTSSISGADQPLLNN